VVLANGRYKCGACDFGGPTEQVHLVGVSISFEKNFYRLPFTPPLSGRLIGPSGAWEVVSAVLNLITPGVIVPPPKVCCVF
jgi:hypothetical protein